MSWCVAAEQVHVAAGAGGAGGIARWSRVERTPDADAARLGVLRAPIFDQRPDALPWAQRMQTEAVTASGRPVLVLRG